MSGLVERMRGATHAPLWLDADDYGERLLAGGVTPWLNVAEYVAHCRKLRALLKPDIEAVPFARLFAAWTADHPALREAMAAKKRAVAPARALLGDEDLRAYLVELLAGLRAAFPGAPLVVALPSPRALIAFAHALAFGSAADIDVGEDEIDGCAVYCAEFLRAFGASQLDALLLEEHAGDEPANADEVAWYQPVFNVAAHYRWDVGLRFADGSHFVGPLPSVQFVIAPSAIEGEFRGQTLPAAFWSEAALEGTPAGDFRHAVVPAQAVPEQVLARLAALRADGA